MSRIGKLIKSLLYLAGIAHDRCESCGERAGRRFRWCERRAECIECAEEDRELDAEALVAEWEERTHESLRQMMNAGVPPVREITLREGEAAALHAIRKAAEMAQVYGGSAMVMTMDDGEPPGGAGRPGKIGRGDGRPVRDRPTQRIPQRMLIDIVREDMASPPPPPQTEKRRD